MKITFYLILSCCLLAVLPSTAKDTLEQGQTILKLIDTFIEDNHSHDNTIIDCSYPAYKPTASHRSLFSWSKRHHEDAVKILQRGKNEIRPISVMTTAETACEKAIEMRGAAYCLRPNNPEYMLGLADTFQVCTELFVNVENMTIKIKNEKKEAKNSPTKTEDDIAKQNTSHGEGQK